LAFDSSFGRKVALASSTVLPPDNFTYEAGKWATTVGAEASAPVHHPELSPSFTGKTRTSSPASKDNSEPDLATYLNKAVAFFRDGFEIVEALFRFVDDPPDDVKDTDEALPFMVESLGATGGDETPLKFSLT
jgi:hypothetical protein